MAIALALVGAIGGSVLPALTPLVVRHVVDDFLVAGESGGLFWILLLVGAGFARFGLSLTRRYYSSKIATTIGHRLRTDIFDAALQSDGNQQDAQQIGTTINRATSDVSAVERSVDAAQQLVTNIVLLVVSAVMLVFLSPMLSMIALPMIPALYLIAKFAMTRLQAASQSYSRAGDHIASLVDQSVRGALISKTFGTEGLERRRINLAASEQYRLGIRRRNLSMYFIPTLSVVPVAGQLGVLAFGGWLALTQAISVGTFIAFAAYLGMMVGPIRIMVGQLTQWTLTRTAIERIWQLVRVRPTVVDGTNHLNLDGTTKPPEIVFDNVSLEYDNGRVKAVRNVTFHVAPGEKVAIVGESGSGKSTLAMMLLRMYDPNCGKISIDGINTKDMTLLSLRRRIGAVLQDSQLFTGTIRENIEFGSHGNCDMEAILNAARLSGADEFVRRLPQSYATSVGESGMALSGGQRQRIALARALVRQPSIVILDDAMSAVDAGLEAEIVESLRDSLRGRTALLIANRRSTLALADRIVVIRGGTVVDSGTDSELLSRCPYYRSLLSGSGSENNPEACDVADALSGTLLSGLSGDAGSARNGDGLDAGFAEERPRNALANPIRARIAPLLVLKPLRVLLIGAFIALALDAAVQIAWPYMTGAVIDRVVIERSSEALVAICVIASITLAVLWVARHLQERLLGEASELVSLRLRTSVFGQLQKLGYSYFESTGPGRIITSLTTDVDAVRGFVQIGVSQVVVWSVTIVGVAVAMLATEPMLTLAALIVCIPLFALSVFQRRVAATRYNTARLGLGELNAALLEYVQSVRVVQAFGRESTVRSQVGEKSLAYSNFQMSAQMSVAVLLAFGWASVEFATAGVLGMAVLSTGTSSVTVGSVAAYMLYIPLLFGPIQNLSQLVDSWQRCKIGLRHLSDPMESNSVIPVEVNPKDVPRGPIRIEFRDVRFSYAPGSSEVLPGIDLVVGAGETVALVGHSGAGKSTILKLITRLYDPTGGAIEVNGVDLREVDPTAYRNRIGVVTQEAHLFPGTVRDAITYAKPDATDADVCRAAVLSGAHSMICRLPGGYASQVGDGGRNLSSGQRQLIALARAQIVAPDLLLLDEATASLDIASEAAVGRAMREAVMHRTSLIIAHRLTTAKWADRIVVLKNGEIAECGSHEELLAEQGLYADLWRISTTG